MQSVKNVEIVEKQVANKLDEEFQMNEINYV